MRTEDVNRLIEELRKALAQPVDAVNMSQDRVDETAKDKHELLYMDMSQVPKEMPNWKPGMVFPSPKKEWVGLTDDEIVDLALSVGSYKGLVQAVEAKLKEKNGG